MVVVSVCMQALQPSVCDRILIDLALPLMSIGTINRHKIYQDSNLPYMKEANTTDFVGSNESVKFSKIAL